MATYKAQDIAFGPGGTAASPTGGVWSLLASRDGNELISRGMYEWIYNACLEISRDFRFQGLERTGPIVTFNTNQVDYDIDYLVQPDDADGVVNLIPSWFRYFNPYSPSGSAVYTNSGSCLKWKSVDALELMFNTPGIPTYFTRYQDVFKVAPVPDNNYYGYLRYQVEHPFTGASGTTADPTDAILFPNEWKVILEYWVAMEGATTLRMLDYAQDYHTKLFGDPEFQRSSGGRGNPGLISRRITQIEGDSTSMMRSIRVNVGSTR